MHSMTLTAPIISKLTIDQLNKFPIPNFIKFLLGLASDTGLLTDRQVDLIST